MDSSSDQLSNASAGGNQIGVWEKTCNYFKSNKAKLGATSNAWSHEVELNRVCESKSAENKSPAYASIKVLSDLQRYLFHSRGKISDPWLHQLLEMIYNFIDIEKKSYLSNNNGKIGYNCSSYTKKSGFSFKLPKGESPQDEDMPCKPTLVNSSTQTSNDELIPPRASNTTFFLQLDSNGFRKFGADIGTQTELLRDFAQRYKMKSQCTQTAMKLYWHRAVQVEEKNSSSYAFPEPQQSQQRLVPVSTQQSQHILIPASQQKSQQFLVPAASQQKSQLSPPPPTLLVAQPSHQRLQMALAQPSQHQIHQPSQSPNHQSSQSPDHQPSESPNHQPSQSQTNQPLQYSNHQPITVHYVAQQGQQAQVDLSNEDNRAVGDWQQYRVLQQHQMSSHEGNGVCWVLENRQKVFTGAQFNNVMVPQGGETTSFNNNSQFTMQSSYPCNFDEFAIKSEMGVLNQNRAGQMMSERNDGFMKQNNFQPMRQQQANFQENVMPTITECDPSSASNSFKRTELKAANASRKKKRSFFHRLLGIRK